MAVCIDTRGSYSGLHWHARDLWRFALTREAPMAVCTGTRGMHDRMSSSQRVSTATGHFSKSILEVFDANSYNKLIVLPLHT